MRPTLPFLAALAVFHLCGCHERKNTDTALITPSAPQEAGGGQRSGGAKFPQAMRFFQATGHGTASKYERLVGRPAEGRLRRPCRRHKQNRSGYILRLLGHAVPIRQDGHTGHSALSVEHERRRSPPGKEPPRPSAAWGRMAPRNALSQFVGIYGRKARETRLST